MSPVSFARRRPRLFCALVLLSALLVGMGAAQWAIWHPRTAEPPQVDAIVVLAYQNDRMELGRKLAAQGVSDVLVLTWLGTLEEMIAEGNAMFAESDHWLEECDTQYEDYFVRCVYPDPLTTAGEAAALADLAAAQGWESIALVTETSHLGRATMFFERCFSGEIYPVASSPSYPWWYLPYRGLYEMGAYGKDFFRTATC